VAFVDLCRLGLEEEIVRDDCSRSESLATSLLSAMPVDEFQSELALESLRDPARKKGRGGASGWDSFSYEDGLSALCIPRASAKGVDEVRWASSSLEEEEGMAALVVVVAAKGDVGAPEDEGALLVKVDRAVR
jgi:hypothetical protein